MNVAKQDMAGITASDGIMPVQTVQARPPGRQRSPRAWADAKPTNAVDQDVADIAVSEEMVPARTVRFRLPNRQNSPRGRGQGRMRELMSFIATRSETYAFRHEGDEWMFASTNRDMLDGSMNALIPLGITVHHRVEETDSPKLFLVVAPDGASRTLEFSWESIDYDMMSMPPHVKRLKAGLGPAILIGGMGASWAGIYAAGSWIAGLL